MVRKKIYADSNLLIAAFEASDASLELADRLFGPERELSVVTSELTIAEVLVGPMRSGDGELEAAYRGVLRNPDLLQLLPVQRDTLFEAACLRSVSSMRLPDAVHVATAILSRCEALVSSDKRLYLPQGLPRLEPNPDALDGWLRNR